MQIPYLSPKEIEGQAEELIRAYGRTRSPIRKPPIPVEDILEGHLGLSLSLDNMRSLLGVPDVLGATNVESREVFIDESLVPESNPYAEGRYLFTVAHEIGHWELHRGLVRAESQATTGSRTASRVTVLCRDSQRGRPIEVQANLYAAALLMPRKLFIREWNKLIGRYIESCLSAMVEDRVWVEGLGWCFPARCPYLKELAADMPFKASAEATRIRLQQLGLVIQGQSNQEGEA